MRRAERRTRGLILKILVIGKNGQLATALAERCRLHGIDAEFLGSDILQMTSLAVLIEQLEKLFTSIVPDVVINTAAYTDVEKAEEESVSNYDLNSRMPLCLALVCGSRNIPLIHISTDFVYDGRKNGAYTERDKTNPINAYGRAKLAGEEVVMQTCSRSIVIRTSWLFARKGRNFITTMVRLMKGGKDIRVVNDEVGAPTYAPDLAEVCIKIADRVLTDPEFRAWGLYHYSGTPQASRYEVAEYVRTVIRESGLIPNVPLIKPISSAEYDSKAKRPKNSILDNSKIIHTFKVSQSNWKDEIRENIMKYYV